MFIAYVRQESVGCDYTIGCAQTLWRLKAETRAEAIEELRHKIIGEWLPEYGEYEDGYSGEDRLDEVTLFEVINEEESPLDKWYDLSVNRVRQAKRKKGEDKERAEFARLKAKYEN